MYYLLSGHKVAAVLPVHAVLAAIPVGVVHGTGAVAPVGVVKAVVCACLALHGLVHVGGGPDGGDGGNAGRGGNGENRLGDHVESLSERG